MLLFISTFFAVFLLGFQQQNVIHGHYRWAAVTSFAIAGFQFLMIKAAVAGSGWDFIQMGAGGALAITASMYAHRRWVRK